MMPCRITPMANPKAVQATIPESLRRVMGDAVRAIIRIPLITPAFEELIRQAAHRSYCQMFGGPTEIKLISPTERRSELEKLSAEMFNDGVLLLLTVTGRRFEVQSTFRL